MLSVENIAFSYGDNVPVLNQFSMAAKAGEIVSLLGPSGCGKSTVLRLIAGLMDASGGAINWHDAPKPNVAFVFQDPALMPWATVQQNVELPGRLKGSIDPDLVSDALSAVGLDAFEKRYPAMLSGGQRMRVSVARAIAARPRLLLMDEPFAALDEILRFQMNDLLLDLVSKRGFGVVFVTHSLFEAAYLSDRVLVMDGGRVTGVIEPKLDRSHEPATQRTSSAFMAAVEAIAGVMRGRAS